MTETTSYNRKCGLKWHNIGGEGVVHVDPVPACQVFTRPKVCVQDRALGKKRICHKKKEYKNCHNFSEEP